MVGLIEQDRVTWMAPSPLWRGDLSVSQPAILRFASDSFMDEFLSMMSYHPERLQEWVAQSETWRQPMPTPATKQLLNTAEPVSRFSRLLQRRRTLPVSQNNDEENGLDFKLFQPAHQRYYLVTASLVCQQPGFPFRKVDGGKREQAAFVVRRIVPTQGSPNLSQGLPSSWDEYAYIKRGDIFVWKKLNENEKRLLYSGEERTPLFNVDYQEGSGRKRKLYAGVVPAAKREAYHAAGEEDEQQGSVLEVTNVDKLAALFQSLVTGPWTSLVEQIFLTKESLKEGRKVSAGNQAERDERESNELKMIRSLREQVQTGSWYLLLDFANFLDTYLDDVYHACEDPTFTPAKISEQKLVEILRETELDGGLKKDLICPDVNIYYRATPPQNLAEAIAVVKNWEEELNKVEVNLDLSKAPSGAVENDDWPNFLFPLVDGAHYFRTNDCSAFVETDVSYEISLGATPDLGASAPDVEVAPVEWAEAQFELLVSKVRAALDDNKEKYGEGPEVAMAMQTTEIREGEWFVIRCAYERPNCGPLHPAVMSQPTRPFQLASFFDPDAPARPIRIPMPLDISPAGLRKFNKNAGFVISDMFCGQLKRMRKLTFGDLVLSVLPWPFHKDLPDPGTTGPCKKGGNSLGMICSLSIPIVTICAFILLLIMVLLFDFFFRWIPYLFVCLPIPGLKGKKA